MAAEDREFERERVEREVAAEGFAEQAAWREHLSQYEHGMSVHEWERHRQELAGAKAARDPSAPYGSEKNPAALIGGHVLDPPPVARSRGY